MKIGVIGEQARKRESQTHRGGVADVDMLIYELQGFSLTILSFTEREREGEKYGEKEIERQTARLQNWGALRDRRGGTQGGKEK